MITVEKQPTKQFFTIQLSKTVFMHADYGYLACHDRLSNPTKFGLQQVLVYAVCLDKFKLSHAHFANTDTPLSAQAFLSHFWGETLSPEEFAHLSGPPDVLVIDKRLNGVLTPSFFDWLRKVGVCFEWSDGKNKAFTSKIRRFQDCPAIFCFDESKELNPFSIEDLNSVCMNHKFLTFHSASSAEKQLAAEYNSNDKRQKIGFDSPDCSIDFDPNSSSLLVPSPNDVECSNLELSSTETPFHYIRVSSGLTEFAESQQDSFKCACSAILTSHPLGIGNIAKELGISAKELKSFAADKGYIDNSVFQNLLTLLGLTWVEGDSVDYFALKERWTIHRVLGISKDRFEAIYDERSCGGDLRFAGELLPMKGIADPSFRLVLTITHDEKYTLYMIDRASQISVGLNERSFINYDGERVVSVKLYTKLLKFVATNYTMLKSLTAAKNQLQNMERQIEDEVFSSVAMGETEFKDWV